MSNRTRRSSSSSRSKNRKTQDTAPAFVPNNSFEVAVDEDAEAAEAEAEKTDNAEESSSEE